MGRKRQGGKERGGESATQMADKPGKRRNGDKREWIRRKGEQEEAHS